MTDLCERYGEIKPTRFCDGTDMEIRKVIREMHGMIDQRLFGRAWLVDWEAAAAIHTRLAYMGLRERVDGDPDTWRATILGKELQLDLFLAFVGCWDHLEVPLILADHGLIDRDECERVFDLLEGAADRESALRDLVRRAYFDWYNPVGRLL
jgi:hypothetical protein